MPVCDRIPPFLTVEEASRLLKIGRTKAYLLTQEWRATGGRSGLAVVDLGDVLRVPGPAIEQMLGTGLGTPRPTGVKPTGSPAGPDARDLTAPLAETAPPEESPAPSEVRPAAGAVREPRVRAGRTRHQHRPINRYPSSNPSLPRIPIPKPQRPMIPNRPPTHEPALPDPHP
jgi:hypothetical protein